jgi:predicted DNA-binding protein
MPIHLDQMPTTSLPQGFTKVSYILPKSQKDKLARLAKKKGKSMSAVITEALKTYATART